MVVDIPRTIGKFESDDASFTLSMIDLDLVQALEIGLAISMIMFISFKLSDSDGSSYDDFSRCMCPYL
jgi:hypothetical protein